MSCMYQLNYERMLCHMSHGAGMCCWCVVCAGACWLLVRARVCIKIKKDQPAHLRSAICA